MAQDVGPVLGRGSEEKDPAILLVRVNARTVGETEPLRDRISTTGGLVRFRGAGDVLVAGELATFTDDLGWGGTKGRWGGGGEGGEVIIQEEAVRGER